MRGRIFNVLFNMATQAGCAALLCSVPGIAAANPDAVRSGATFQRASFPTARYARAERFMTYNVKAGWHRSAIFPTWLGDGDRFWYRVTTAGGPEFYLVDPRRREKKLLFERSRLKRIMARVAGRAIEAAEWEKLVVRETRNGLEAELSWPETIVTCALQSYECSARPHQAEKNAGNKPPSVVSPDGRLEAYRDQDNLFVRRLNCGAADGKDCGKPVQLTSDGSPYWSYATGGFQNFPYFTLRSKQPPAVIWSPDSNKLLVSRLDIRGVGWNPIVVHTGRRAKAFMYPSSQSGDEHVERFDVYVADVEKRSVRRVQIPQIEATQFFLWDSKAFTRWAYDSKRLYLLTPQKMTELSLLSVDPESGSARTLIHEPEAVLELPRSMESVLDATAKGDDLIWWSERDGWAHLYRGSLQTGALQQITRGKWNIRKILRADLQRGVLYMSALGREAGSFPYHEYIYRMHLDGSELRLLTPEAANHQVTFSPSGRYMIDSYSSIDRLPTIVLRDANNGKVLLHLERSDASTLATQGWKLPEIVSALAADGKTWLYGTLRKPSDFDPMKKYPVVVRVYPVPRGSLGAGGWRYEGDHLSYEQTALAELGFIVVEIQGRGSMLRGKAFRNSLRELNGRYGEATAVDQRAALLNLARTRPWMDLDRVGIYGASGGGNATVNAMLRFPDFFKVGVALSGNHDDRSYSPNVIGLWRGPMAVVPGSGTDNYTPDANPALAANLKGKLLLGVGMLDEGVNPSQTFLLIDALVKANKKFDLFMNPEGYHGVAHPSYLNRVIFDYFVEHLFGAIPPEYKFSSPLDRVEMAERSLLTDRLKSGEYDNDEVRKFRMQETAPERW